MQVKEFALYKGEEIIAMGTKREIAEQLGISVRSVDHYGTPAYAKRTSEEHGRRFVELWDIKLLSITTTWKMK